MGSRRYAQVYTTHFKREVDMKSLGRLCAAIVAALSVTAAVTTNFTDFAKETAAAFKA